MTERYARKRSRIWSLVRLLLVISVVELLFVGVRFAHAYVLASPRFAVVAGHATFVAPAPWLTPADLAGIRRDCGLAGRRFSYFAPGLVSRFAAAYRRSPWVEEVREVRPRYPNRVDVVLRIRKPLAGVVVEDRDVFLVDESGIRLPGVRRGPPEGLGTPFFRLYGVSAPVPYPGDVWSRGVTEGMAVARRLAEVPDLVRAAGIVGIDVSNVGLRVDRRESEILLRTASGAVIEWGRSELSPWAANECPVRHKLELLRTALAAFPGLAGLARLRVHFENLGYFRRD